MITNVLPPFHGSQCTHFNSNSQNCVMGLHLKRQDENIYATQWHISIVNVYDECRTAPSGCQPWSPVSIQTRSLALCALRKRKPQETQALALASSQSCLPLLRPIAFLLAGACVCCVKISRKKTQAPARAFLAVFVYATHATQAIEFEWKPGLRQVKATEGLWVRL